jgi:hypothetical protein
MSRTISVTPDETILWDLAFLGLSDRHIAQAIGCHQSLISKRPDIVKILQQARDERAEAIVALWARSSQGALRGERRPQELVELVREGEQRKIRRLAVSDQQTAVSRQELLNADRCLLTAVKQRSNSA